MSLRIILLAVCLVVTLAGSSLGCSVVNDPGQRMGGDAGFDSGFDGGFDSGFDAGFDSGFDAGPPYEPMDFCQDYAEIGCDAIENCCSTGDPRPLADCINALNDDCRRIIITTVLANPSINWDGDRARAGVARGRALGEACSTDIIDWFFVNDGFYAGTVGTIASGDPCEIGGGVENELLEVLSCAEDAQVCRGGSCVAISDSGGPCTNALHCTTTRCEAPGPMGCSNGRPGGASCSTAQQCDSYSCSGVFPNRMCDPLTQDLIYCGLGAMGDGG